jgi:YggT family protein
VYILSLLINTVAGLFAGVFLLRFWMQAIRIRPPQPVAQFLYQLSDWLVKPLRRVLPGVGGYDWACLIGAFLVALAAAGGYLLLLGIFSPQTLALMALALFLQWILYGFIGLVILDVLFSLLNPQAPLADFVRALADPFMRPLRRLIPPIGIVDLSPLVALVLLQIALYLVHRLLPILV